MVYTSGETIEMHIGDLNSIFFLDFLGQLLEHGSSNGENRVVFIAVSSSVQVDTMRH